MRTAGTARVVNSACRKYHTHANIHKYACKQSWTASHFRVACAMCVICMVCDVCGVCMVCVWCVICVMCVVCVVCDV